MSQYTDDDIRNMKKISCKVAADYLGVNVMWVRYGMRKEKLPIGFAFLKSRTRYTENWSYCIIPERLIAYKYGKINEVTVDGIENNLQKIIEQFEEMKRDLIPLLRAKKD